MEGRLREVDERLAEAPADRDSSTLKVVDAALDVLLFLGRVGGEVGVRDLARGVGVPRSSAARIISTLKRRGFLLQNELTSQYRLGPRILEVAAAYQRSVELRRLALPDMMTLASASGESVFLCVLDGADVVILERVDGPNPLRMMTEPGAREPVYCTGLGKVLLAGIPEAERDALIGSIALEPKTAKTILTVGGLIEQVRVVEAHGFAFDNEEFQPGTSCIAVPIREYGGAIVAALSISGPTFRMSPPRTEDLVQLVNGAGRSISRKVGHEVEANDDFPNPRGLRRASD